MLRALAAIDLADMIDVSIERISHRNIIEGPGLRGDGEPVLLPHYGARLRGWGGARLIAHCSLLVAAAGECGLAAVRGMELEFDDLFTHLREGVRKP
ncbi:MAG TPA: hypothetical protein VGH40_01780 [Roseiarcus sp.]